MDVNWCPPPPGPSLARIPSQPEWSWRAAGHCVMGPSYGDHLPSAPSNSDRATWTCVWESGGQDELRSCQFQEPRLAGGRRSKGFLPPLGLERAKEVSRCIVPGLVGAK